MKPHIRLVNDEYDFKVEQDNEVKVPSGHDERQKPNHRSNYHKKNVHHLVIGAAAVGTVTVIELKHGGHILIEPFESANSFTEAINDLAGLSDGGITGWFVWLAVVGASIFSGISWCIMRIREFWVTKVREKNDNK